MNKYLLVIINIEYNNVNFNKDIIVYLYNKNLYQIL